MKQQLTYTDILGCGLVLFSREKNRDKSEFMSADLPVSEVQASLHPLQANKNRCDRSKYNWWWY